MKKNLLTACFGCLASALLFSNSFAQTAAPFNVDQDRFSSQSTTIEKPESAVPSKVVRSFQLSFKNITPEWYALGKNYLVKFTMDGQPGHAVFGKNGFMLYSICRGSEKDLPTDVRRLVKSNYIEYTITRVTKARSNDRTGWIVNLQDDKSLVIVKVVDREMEELEHYQKSGTAK